MIKKKSLFAIALSLVLLTAACGKEKVTMENVPANAPGTETSASTETAAPEPTEKTDPKEVFSSDEGFCNFLMQCWKSEMVHDIYPYASDDIKALMGDSFDDLFLRWIRIFGGIEDFENIQYTEQAGGTYCVFTVVFKEAKANITLYVKDRVLQAFVTNVRFTEEFDLQYDAGVVETYFVFESDGHKLNAVYTHTDKANAPTVLLIPGSGVADYNETIGMLAPFEDIAIGLAKRGINCLRVEKRTCGYPEEATAEFTLKEEYFTDYTNAIKWLKDKGADKIYLLGHSLGAQIAPVLACENKVEGMILFNGSARHMADLMVDQYSLVDPDNAVMYEQAAKIVKAADYNSAVGVFYYGASDLYWAGYNELDTIASIRQAGIPTLIINSGADNQIFEKDCELWKTELSNDANVTIKMADGCSHFGYKIDTMNQSNLYTPQIFPAELLDSFAEFIQ